MELSYGLKESPLSKTIAKEQISVQLEINNIYDHQLAMDSAIDEEAARKTLQDAGFNVSQLLIVPLFLGKFAA